MQENVERFKPAGSNAATKMVFGNVGSLTSMAQSGTETSTMADSIANLPQSNVVELEISYAPKSLTFYLSPWAGTALESKKLCAGVLFKFPIKRILTCAHCVADATSINVRLPSHKMHNVQARVTDVSHDLDLALLTLPEFLFEDEGNFWNKFYKPLDFTEFEFPELFSDVFLIGYIMHLLCAESEIFHRIGR